MTVRSIRHRITDPSANPHGIHGEISVVVEAIKDARSSAT